MIRCDKGEDVARKDAREYQECAKTVDSAGSFDMYRFGG